MTQLRAVIFISLVSSRCIRVRMRAGLTETDGHSWSLGSCFSDASYRAGQEHITECCLPYGNYTLKCKDSGGGGWRGGAIYIDGNGNSYCSGFVNGTIMAEEISITGK